MEITLVSALPEDTEQIFLCCQHLILEYEDLTAIDLPAVLNWVRRKVENHLSWYRRILADGQLAGYVSFHPAWGADFEGKMELDDLYIFPEYRRQGIGAQVIGHCLRQSGRPVILYVFCANRGAKRLYERFGFREVRQVGKTRLIMEWPSQGASLSAAEHR